ATAVKDAGVRRRKLTDQKACAFFEPNPCRHKQLGERGIAHRIPPVSDAVRVTPTEQALVSEQNVILERDHADRIFGNRAITAESGFRRN
ncbi:hypothetical protein, partial [Sphingobium yanoikuyae]|uniref:hypothetical protein n=2 Tax=Sphingomonadaceae TaxID=41297 RepID=UPI001F48B514